MPFEKGLFYLPCPNQVDDMPPSFEGWYNPHQRWNGWYAPLFNEETYDKICAYYGDEKTNTKESIDDLKEFMDKRLTSLLILYLWKVSYEFGSCYLCWGMRTMNKEVAEYINEL